MIVLRSTANNTAVFTWKPDGNDISQCSAAIEVNVMDPNVKKYTKDQGDCSAWSRSLQCKQGSLKDNTVYYNQANRTWETRNNTAGSAYIAAETVEVVDDGECCWGSHNLMMKNHHAWHQFCLRPYLLVLAPAHMPACDGTNPLPGHPICTSWASADWSTGMQALPPMFICMQSLPYRA